MFIVYGRYISIVCILKGKFLRFVSGKLQVFFNYFMVTKSADLSQEKKYTLMLHQKKRRSYGFIRYFF